jgi:hypothetical protein
VQLAKVFDGEFGLKSLSYDSDNLRCRPRDDDIIYVDQKDDGLTIGMKHKKRWVIT